MGGVDFTSAQNPVGQDGLATGTIKFNDTAGNKVPDGAEIVAAYLYFEAIYSQGTNPLDEVKFRGTEIDPNDEWENG